MKKRRSQDPGKKDGGAVLVFFASILTLAGVGIFLLTGSDGRASSRPLGSLTAAKVAYADRDYKLAVEILRDLADHDFEAKVFLGRVLLENGRLTEAREIFSEAMKKDPENYEVLRGMAKVYEGMGQGELAVVYYHRAAELRKDDPHAWRELALAQKRSGDSVSALSSIQQALALDPDQADLSNMLTELATGNHMAGASQPQTPGMGQFRFDPMNPKPIDPSSLVPQPKVPDPNQWLPKPGHRGH